MVGVAVVAESSRASAHGPTTDQLAGAALVALIPAVGAESLQTERQAPKPRVLVSWQFNVPLELRDEGITRHRLLLAVEVVHDGEVRGRLGYRFVHAPLFVGAGAATSRDLGVAGTAELGLRFFTFGDDSNAALFVVAHTHVSLRDDRPWATGAAAGFTFY